MANQETLRFLPGAIDVKARAIEVFQTLFVDRATVTLDYISLFPRDEQELITLQHDAAWFGHRVAYKNGALYKLNELRAELGTAYVRIREPQAVGTLLGCADLVTLDYEADRAVLAKRLGASGFQEELKEAPNGQTYSIMQVTDSARRVALHIPSMRMTEALAGSATKRV